MAHAELAQPIHVIAPTRGGTNQSHTVIAIALMVLALGGGFIVGGQPARFAIAGLQYAPAILLAGLLHLREHKAARVLSWIWFWLMLLVIGGIAIALTFAGDQPLGTRVEPQKLLAPAGATLAILVAGAVLAGTPLWQLVARTAGATAIDRRNPAHAQGTVGLVIGSALAIVPLILLGGRAPLVSLLSNTDATAVGGMTEQLLDEIAAVAWTVVLVLWAAAWPARNTLRQAFDRLGLGPLVKSDAVALSMVTLVLFGVGTAVDAANHLIFTSMGWPTTDGSIVTRLMPVATTPVGAVLIAICAGLSEELLFRGLLQPRYGWFLANLAFAAMHAFQYGLDGLVSVFVLGAALALVRARWNTTASIGVHVGYDMLLLLLAQLGF